MQVIRNIYVNYPILANHQCTFDTNTDSLSHMQMPSDFLRLNLLGSILSLRYPLKHPIKPS